jgi:hypothetical protein
MGSPCGKLLRRFSRHAIFYNVLPALAEVLEESYAFQKEQPTCAVPNMLRASAALAYCIC